MRFSSLVCVSRRFVRCKTPSTSHYKKRKPKLRRRSSSKELIFENSPKTISKSLQKIYVMKVKCGSKYVEVPLSASHVDLRKNY